MVYILDFPTILPTYTTEGVPSYATNTLRHSDYEQGWYNDKEAKDWKQIIAPALCRCNCLV
jgi:hypothetical protein